MHELGIIIHISKTLKEVAEDYLVCANNKVKITESDGKTHRTKETAILFFYKNEWFNILAQLKKFGLFYYCNIATPYIIDDNVIKYIDYDLDLRVFPNGSFKVLDRNEYKYHKKQMHYSNRLDFILKYELGSLIERVRIKKDPFNKKAIEKYYEKYLELLKKEDKTEESVTEQAKAGEESVTEQTESTVQESDKKEEANVSESYEEQYGEVLDKYYAALSEKWDGQKLSSEGLSQLSLYCQEGNALENVGYAFLDVNGDGVCELMIGAIHGDEFVNKMLFELYTLEDGVPVQIFAGQERDDEDETDH